VARPPLLDLLAAFRAGRTDFPPGALSSARLAWVIESGLAPLLARVSPELLARGGADADAVRGADLAARIVAADQAEATVALVDACLPSVGPLTLLKGIWLSHALYPEPHLRPMRDVDVMVAPERVAEVEGVLRALGYEPQPEAGMGDFSAHHHSAPLRHPDTGVVFEVHRALVPPSGPFARVPAFTAESVRRHLRADTFHGRPILRLSHELQLSYLSAHWSSSFKVIGGAGGLLVLLDLMALLEHVDWAAAADDLRGSPAALSLWLLLTYLETRGLQPMPPDARASVHPLADAMGALNLAVLRRLVDRRVADGRPYGRVVFTRRTFEIVWKAMLRPGSSAAHLAALPWHLLPSRWRGGRSL
jgi:hypothetical protein